MLVLILLAVLIAVHGYYLKPMDSVLFQRHVQHWNVAVLVVEIKWHATECCRRRRRRRLRRRRQRTRKHHACMSDITRADGCNHG